MRRSDFPTVDPSRRNNPAARPRLRAVVGPHREERLPDAPRRPRSRTPDTAVDRQTTARPAPLLPRARPRVRGASRTARNATVRSAQPSAHPVRQVRWGRAAAALQARSTSPDPIDHGKRRSDSNRRASRPSPRRNDRTRRRAIARSATARSAHRGAARDRATFHRARTTMRCGRGTHIDRAD